MGLPSYKAPDKLTSSWQRPTIKARLPHLLLEEHAVMLASRNANYPDKNFNVGRELTRIPLREYPHTKHLGFGSTQEECCFLEQSRSRPPIDWTFFAPKPAIFPTAPSPVKHGWP